MDDLRDKYLTAIADAAGESALEDLRLAAVGKKGEISLKMRELGKMSPEERQVMGPKLNALKDEINSALAAKKQALSDAALDERLRAEWLDVTLPARGRRMGTIHPVSQVTEEVTAIFADMALPWPKARRWKAIGTISTRSTSPATTPRAPRWIPSTCTAPKATTARRMCCGPIPRRCKSARWRRRARPFA